jgi:hypothetical protein
MPYFSFGDNNATFSLCCIVECTAEVSHLWGERMPVRFTVMQCNAMQCNAMQCNAMHWKTGLPSYGGRKLLTSLKTSTSTGQQQLELIDAACDERRATNDVAA